MEWLVTFETYWEKGLAAGDSESCGCVGWHDEPLEEATRSVRVTLLTHGPVDTADNVQ